MDDDTPHPTRRTERLRTATVWVAVGAILLSLWALWDFWDRRHTIDEACAGLVPPGAVLDLSLAGGEIAWREEEAGRIDLAEDFPQRCSLSSGDSAEASDSKADHLPFFTAEVSVESADPSQARTWGVDPHDPFRRFTWRGFTDQPVGGGIDGSVTDTGAVVRLPCTGGSSRGEEVEAITASALQRPFRFGSGPVDERGQMSQADRDTLVRIAVDTANTLAERLGCRERLPDPPQHVPGVRLEPVAAERADGTCAWFDRAEHPADAREWLPDQAYESRIEGEVWNEQCLLRLSPEAQQKVVSRHRDDPALDRFYGALRRDHSLWARTESFFGDPARHVELDDLGELVRPDPGTAGKAHSYFWWASSVCDGEPALHTLTLGLSYSRGAQQYYDTVFRAYVDAVAERRGCEQVRFPDADTFTRP